MPQGKADLSASDRFTARVREEWTIDGHVDVGSFSRLFDLATDHFRDRMELGKSYAEPRDRGLFVVEAHITYRDEVRVGETIAVATRLLGFDAKRLHLFHEMEKLSSRAHAATCELLILHVNRSAGRATPLDADQIAHLEERLHLELEAEYPAEVGRSIRSLLSQAPFGPA